jgi:serine/threonine protein kinase/alpha-beta hydrolase superfamily lysophospholipase
VGVKRWERIQDLFLQAIERPAADRAVFVDEVSGGDDELRHELTSLLRSHERTGLMDSSGHQGPSAEDLERLGRVSTAIAERYRVEREIGRGGMATVLLAQDLRHRRPVAIKVLSPRVATSLTDAHFLREIEISARLRHPHILPLFDSGEAAGLPFFVMPYVQGETLRQRLDREGALAVQDALRIGREVADALGHAHARGVVHRDIKPGNILLEERHALVADFGIGRAMDFADSEKLTRTGVSVGTPTYMSPEQISGEDVDHRSDLYSLACVLFEMLAGRPPFVGRSVVNLVKQHVLERPPLLTAAAPAVPAWLSEVVDRSLAKSPDERHQTAEELMEALDPVRSEAPQLGDSRPRVPAGVPDQDIRFCASGDGVRLAYAVAGDGPPLVKASNWLNHLEYDWESPIWAPLLHELVRDFRLVRYDERGTGLSDRDVPEMSFEAFVRDLEAVADAAGLERFPLLGVSQGCAFSIAYAARHPERVTHLVLYGGYSRGLTRRGKPGEAEEAEAIITLMTQGWGKENPAYRQIFTSRMIPGGTPEQIQWLNDLQRITTSPENAVRIRRALNVIDVEDLLPTVKAPTLVMHCRDDAIVPFEEGKRVAARIQGARFVALEGENHLLMQGDPGWSRFLAEIRGFLLG